MPFTIDECACGIAKVDCPYHRPEPPRTQQSSNQGLQSGIAMQMLTQLRQGQMMGLNWQMNPCYVPVGPSGPPTQASPPAKGFKIRYTMLKDTKSFGMHYPKGQSGWYGEGNANTPQGKIFGTREAAETTKEKIEKMYGDETAYEIFPA